MSLENQVALQKKLQMHEPTKSLIKTVIDLIESTKSHVTTYTNSALVMLYWKIGGLINQETLNNKRAEYGEQTLVHIANELTGLYGSGFDRANISRMIKFSKLYPDQQICVTLSQQLSWSHIVRLIAIDDELKRVSKIH